MKNAVITIGREYGSGGKYIGEQVAEKLNIPFYDKEIIAKTYDRYGVNYSKLDAYDEKMKSSILKSLELFGTNNYEDVFDDTTIHGLISNTIKDYADSGSCVILGRNSNNILKERDNVINIFIYSNNLEFKIQRKMGLEEISHEEAFRKLKRIDKQRKDFYQSLNDSKWGYRMDYDYLIDSEVLGIDGTIDLIVDIYTKYRNK